MAWSDPHALGREHYRKPIPPAPDDLSIVCFTSGTTGNPKGVMLTHGNVVADFSGFLKVTDKVIFPNQDDCLISFLPLAHMFERLIESVVYCHGGRIGFYQGDIRLLPDDMKALRPTIFPVVPRLLNRMYDKIFSQANSPLKRWLLNFAAKRKGAEVSSGIIRSDSIWDKIFFSKIQASLGGRLRMIITGAAPTSPSVLGFLRAALGCQVYEAYGQTECTAGCTFTTPGDWTPGHVGAPLPCNLIKLVDVPEKNYFASKGEGEVCVKGPNVFKGYLKDPERTAETLDADGWLHTGDIGKWLPNGTLKIIDRKKHIFKLAQGEYISPEKLRTSTSGVNLWLSSMFMETSCLVGIVVPDPEVMPEWAKKKGILGTYKDLCKNTELKKVILEDLVRLGKASGLHSFEQVKNIYIHNEMFSIENGLLTPTLKAKRPELKEFFKAKIEQLYSSISISNLPAKHDQTPQLYDSKRDLSESSDASLFIDDGTEQVRGESRQEIREEARYTSSEQKIQRPLPKKLCETIIEEPGVEKMIDPSVRPVSAVRSRVKPVCCKSVSHSTTVAHSGNPRHTAIPASPPSQPNPGYRVSPARLPSVQTTPDPRKEEERNLTVTPECTTSSDTEEDTTFSSDVHDSECYSSASSSSSSLSSPEIFRRDNCVQILTFSMMEEEEEQGPHRHIKTLPCWM
ncbi:hypothetical protein INR49_002527 [Caranx melampygus]|nr:hypothetical protein INR49_002527 [Caranx melampygus]